MKRTALCLALMFGVAAPAFAQIGGALGKIKRGVDTAKKVSDMHISDKDERAIGEAASQMLIDRFGVYQDRGVSKYITLVGTVLAQESSRPSLNWQFIVLDTDGVNAYAAPGGIVHITRGALGLIKSEAELAGVLGHEITHITAKHTINSIQRSKGTEIAVDQTAAATGGLGGAAISLLGNAAYDALFENKFSREEETDSDRVGVTLANKVGYSPSGLSAFLTTLSERNKTQKEPNGLFASHPQIKDRLEEIGKTIKRDKLTASAMGQARYASTVKVEAKPIAEIAVVTPGVRGVAGGSPSAAKEEPKKEEPKKEEPPEKKKRGFGLGNLAGGLTQGSQKESTQASASGGSRMGVPDRDAAGGPNKTRVTVTLTPAEVAEFKKGIA